MHEPMIEGRGGVLLACQAAPDLSSAYARVGRELAIQLSRHRQVQLIGCHGNVASEYTMVEGQLSVPVHPYPWAFFETEHINQLAARMNAELVIYVGDAWPFARKIFQSSQDIPWVLMAPVDHVPLVATEQVLAQQVAAWACPTEWGTAAIRAAEGNGVYVPHGVSQALRDAGAALGLSKAAACERLGWEPGVLRFLSVGGNVGDRKNLAGILRAWGEAAIPDAELVIWAYPTRDDSNPDGLDLLGAARELGISNVRFPDPYQVACGYPDADLAAVYVGSDALVQASKTEGFGIPIAEAQALGVPALVTDYAPYLEVSAAENSDLTFPLGTWELMQLLGTAWMPTPSHRGMVEVFRRFAAHGIDPEEMDRRIDHAQAYSWEDAALTLNAEIARVLVEKTLKPAESALVGAS